VIDVMLNAGFFAEALSLGIEIGNFFMIRPYH